MPGEVFHWPSIKERLLTPDGRFIFEDHIYPDIAWDVLVEAAKRHHLQDMYDDAWRHLTTARDIRDHGLGGYDGQMQFCFFWLLTAMIKVQLKVYERDGKLPDNLTGNRNPGAMSTLSVGESTDFVMIDMEELRAVVPEWALEGTPKGGVMKKLAAWVFGTGKK